jgi:hypothetical protein
MNRPQAAILGSNGRASCNLFVAGFLLGLIVDPENGGDKFTHNFGGLLPRYTEL